MRHVFRYLVADPPAPGDVVTLAPADSHHLARVVRRRPGDVVELGDGAGAVWSAHVLDPGPPATVRVASRVEARAPAPVTLYQGILEWGRLDVLVEKAVELGVGEIVLVATERSRRVPEQQAWERRRARVLRVAESAVRQSGRAVLPAVRGLVPFGDAMREITPGEGFLIDPRGDEPLAAALAGRSAGTALVVGPEAGFSDGEAAAARAAGLRACTLGPAVLRAETAGIAAVVLATAGREG
ncbi:MAG: 16S rRNA (uracil(1498)-N(3))-methyltransferase [Thermoleophilia bacterium]